MIAALLLALSPPPVVGNVLVVGPGPGELPEIQAAVDAALDGDIVLVRSGTYDSFVVHNKSIAVAADTGAVVNVAGTIRARHLSAERSVLFSGLHAQGTPNSSPTVADGLFVLNCAGVVTVQDCELRGFAGAGAPCPSTGGQGARVESSGAVLFERCTLEGTSGNRPFGGGFPPGSTSHGVQADGSSLALYSSTARGGDGGLACLGYVGDGENGGDGVRMTSSSLVAQNTQFFGGRGSDVSVIMALAGNGGNGITPTDSSSSCVLFACSAQGGTGGMSWSCGFCGYCCNGGDGVAYYTYSGSSYQHFSEPARDLYVGAVARESTAVPVQCQGVAGDFVSLRIARTTGFAFSPQLHGVVATGGPQPAQYLILGTLSTTTLNVMLPLGPIPVASANVFRLQSLHVAADGSRWLGDPRALVVLDSSF